MPSSRAKLALLGAAVALTPGLLLLRARGSDHADTPAIAARPGADLTDVYIFPAPGNPNNVVLVMNAHPLIPAGQGPATAFDPNVLYQFKIDNTGDNVEDKVIQARFSGAGAGQQVHIAGPVTPSRTGIFTQAEIPDPMTGQINSTFTLSNGVKVFAGAREDPFFFDLNRFFQILPDRATPINPNALPAGQNPNAPQKTSFRGFPQTEVGAGPPQDFLAGLNVLSIVVEMPKSMLRGAGSGNIRVWCTTSI